MFGKRLVLILGPIMAVGFGLQGSMAHAAGTQWTSEERGPINCPTGELIRGVLCDHDYCDNIGIICDRTDWTLKNIAFQYWSKSSISEETGKRSEYAGNRYDCAEQGAFMTGFRCFGSYCDNLKMQCTRYLSPDGKVNYIPVSCVWTSRIPNFSEEEKAIYFPSGMYLAGVECAGSYCDDKRFRICYIGSITPTPQRIK
jgi:hypothetical protein